MRRALITLALLALLAPAAAQASATQESMFQDDNLLEFSPPATVARTLDELKGLGVDRVRVTVFWTAVAPLSDSQTKPKGFDGSDPDNYPDARWERYDTLTRLAAARGIGVMFDIAGPAPKWATPPHAARQDLDDTWAPDPAELAAFTAALGKRYSGSFLARADRPKTTTTPPKGLPGVPGYEPEKTTTTPAGPPLPRVDTWELWNEPNQPGWLDPQWTLHGPKKRRRWIPTSPTLYRAMADAMYWALGQTGHGADTILVGATAPKGLDVKGLSRAIKPLQFIRELYCVNRFNQRFRGRQASYRGCPTGRDAAARFVADHPVLFRATGFSHHPYELTFAPDRRPSDPLYLTIANLPRLADALRRAWLRYGQPVPSGGVPLYLTEFGYQTNPPDRLGVSPRKQARYLDQAEYIAWRNPAVRTLSQFLLVDGGEPVGLTFQSGLRWLDGRAKPAYRSYRLPVWIPDRRVRRGGRLRVWGLVRPAANGASPKVRIQFRRRGAKRWRTIATRQGSAARGYLYDSVTMPGTGRVRLRWGKVTSRAVGVRG